MELYLDRRASRQIRVAAQEAIEEGDLDALREEILEAFGEEQVEEIERRLDSADFYEHLTDVLDEWSGDDSDELFELLETQLSEIGLDLKFETGDVEEDDEEEEEEEEVDEEPDPDDFEDPLLDDG